MVKLLEAPDASDPSEQVSSPAGGGVATQLSVSAS
jgi:hypothetical protein